MISMLFKTYVLFVFSLSFVSQYFSSPILRSLDDVVFFIGISVAILFMRKSAFKNARLSLYVIPIFLLLSSFWGIMNGNQLEVILLTIRQFKNVFLFIIIAALSKNQFGYVHRTLQVCLILSIPLSLHQFIYLDHWDKISGFFGVGASGTLSLLILIFVFSELFYRLANGKRLIDYYLILLLPILLNETKLSFLLIPYLLICSYYITGKLKFKNIFIGSVICLTLIIMTDKLYSNVYGHSLTGFFEAQNLERYFMAGDGLYITDDNEIDIGRALRIKMAFEKISSDGMSIQLFGYGLGSTFVGTASGLYGVEARNSIGSGLNIGSRIQLYQMLVEFGMVGSLFLIFMFVYFYRKIISHGNFDRVNTTAIVAMNVAFIGLIYQNILISREISFLIFCSTYMAILSRNQSMPSIGKPT